MHDHPEWHERTKVVYFGRALRRAARRADLVICVSEATRRRFVEIFAPRAPVIVIPHGVDHARFCPSGEGDEEVLAALGVRRPYLFHLGTHEPRKGVDTLLMAFERLAADRPDLQLVLAGHRGWGTADLAAEIARLEATGRARRLGYVADEALPALLRSAAAVVYPSREEGFGLPALEALACGAPLVTTEGSVMAELAGDACIGAPAGDADALSAAIGEALAGAGAPARRTRGLAVAAGYRWDQVAAAHLDAYRSVAG
jgi:glycosyltransferase involved in cell wall biosynthesis